MFVFRKTNGGNCQHSQVDVIFDDDVGFLAAIKTFMTTTKRPVILTTSGKCTISIIRLHSKPDVIFKYFYRSFIQREIQL